VACGRAEVDCSGADAGAGGMRELGSGREGTGYKEILKEDWAEVGY